VPHISRCLRDVGILPDSLGIFRDGTLIHEDQCKSVAKLSRD
jgi:hypothetical protein